MVAFNVDVAIAEFMADPVRSSLKLEHMTTGERKETKKLVAEYTELRCESYGFGSERQLHLFKKGADEAKEVEECAADTSIKNLSSQDKLEVEGSPGPSTIPSTRASPAASDLEPVELRVRNTFIHMEGLSVDERAVQSMPHGMFRQCMLSEAFQAKVAEEIPEFPSTPSGSEFSEPEMEPMAGYYAPKQLLPFSVGTLVVVEGLVKAPGFNGRSAVVQGWDSVTGRYDIVLASPSGCQQAKVKEDNLRMVLPCP